MINREELKELVRVARLTILNEITLLSKANESLGQIFLEIDSECSDEYLMTIIASNTKYRCELAKVLEEYDEDERAFWHKMLHIDD